MRLNVVLEVQPEDDDQYLTSEDRFGLAKQAIFQLLSQIKTELRIDNWDLHLIMDSVAARMERIMRGNEDWGGNDLAKAKREAARDAVIGTKVRP